MCKLCEIKPVYEFTNQRKLCKNCFSHWFEKKFLYTIRKFQMISENDILGYENKKDFRNVVLIALLKMLERKAPIKISNQKYHKKAIADTTDTISKKIVSNLVESNLKQRFNPVDKKIIRPLYLFLDVEVLLYANLKGLKFNKIKKEKNKWFDFVEDLEKKHPEIKRGILNSYLELYN